MIDLNIQLYYLCILLLGKSSDTIFNLSGYRICQYFETVLGHPYNMILALCAVSYYAELTAEHAEFSIYVYRKLHIIFQE